MIDMRKAEIANGTVVNVVEVDPANVPDWCVDWPDAGHAGPGWIVGPDGSLAPPLPTMTEAEATAQIIAEIDAAAVAITGAVPEVERLSWTAKEQAARAWLDGRGVDFMLEAEAAATGETLDDLAQKIVKNADRYRAAVARMTGLRRAAMSDPREPHEVLEWVKAQLAALINPV